MLHVTQQMVDVSAIHKVKKVVDEVSTYRYWELEDQPDVINFRKSMDKYADQLCKLGPGESLDLPERLEANYFLGVVYISYGSKLFDIVFTNSSGEFTSVGESGFSELNVKVSFGELLYVGVKEVTIPIIFRGDHLSESQKLCLGMGDSLTVNFAFKQNLEESDSFVNLDGVFIKEEIVDVMKLFGYAVSAPARLYSSLSSFPSAILDWQSTDTDLAPISNLFIAEDLPFEAWDFAVSEVVTICFEPTYKYTAFTKKIKVYPSNVSALSARKDYTELYLKLRKTNVSGKLEKLFGLVSIYVESIESSPVWEDTEVSNEAPKLDGFKEAAEILQSVLDLYRYKEELLSLESSISSDLFEERKTILDSAVDALSHRVYAFADYAAELYLLGKLLLEKKELSAQVEKELESLSKLSSWDSGVAKIIGQAITNEAMAADTDRKTKELASLSENIAARISYLKSLKVDKQLGF